jgi:hypothetical protein
MQSLIEGVVSSSKPTEIGSITVYKPHASNGLGFCLSRFIAILEIYSKLL